MKKNLCRVLWIALLVGNHLNAQSIKALAKFDVVKKYDLSVLWITDSIEDDEGKKYPKIEPYGFKMPNYQRFYIHLISAVKNIKDENEYIVTGKTMFMDTIRSFKGTIYIEGTEIRTYPILDTNCVEGSVGGSYYLYEDSSINNSGFLVGDFSSEYKIDQNGKLSYDALLLVADGYKNNQFKGLWKKNHSRESKICNWGDSRIPGSNGFDVGTGDFNPDDKYLKFGWENLVKSYGGNYTEKEIKQARLIENRQWWK